MTRAKCFECGEARDFEQTYPTASPEIVRIDCGTCRGKRFGFIVPTSPSGKPVDLVDEAKRIFADVIADPIVTESDAHRAARTAAGELAPPRPDPVLEVDTRVDAAYRAWLATEAGKAIAKVIRDRALAERALGKDHGSIVRITELVRDEARAAGRELERPADAHLARMARDLMRKYAELEGFFDVRVLEGEQGTCRSCGAAIRWVETRTGKRMPMDPDGTTHFATCPQSRSWSRSKKETAS